MVRDARGETLMFRHGATCLAGPVSKGRVWWISSIVEVETTQDTAKAANVPEEEIRHDLVDRVRREIAEGIYDTSDKWEIALERLLNRV